MTSEPSENPGWGTLQMLHGDSYTCVGPKNRDEAMNLTHWMMGWRTNVHTQH